MLPGNLWAPPLPTHSLHTHPGVFGFSPTSVCLDLLILGLRAVLWLLVFRGAHTPSIGPLILGGPVVTSWDESAGPGRGTMGAGSPGPTLGKGHRDEPPFLLPSRHPPPTPPARPTAPHHPPPPRGSSGRLSHPYPGPGLQDMGAHGEAGVGGPELGTHDAQSPELGPPRLPGRGSASRPRERRCDWWKVPGPRRDWLRPARRLPAARDPAGLPRCRAARAEGCAGPAGDPGAPAAAPAARPRHAAPCSALRALLGPPGHRHPRRLLGGRLQLERQVRPPQGRAPGVRRTKWTQLPLAAGEGAGRAGRAGWGRGPPASAPPVLSPAA